MDPDPQHCLADHRTKLPTNYSYRRWWNNFALTYGLEVFLVHANEGLFENFFHVFIYDKKES
jgi:hypothetical protein